MAISAQELERHLNVLGLVNRGGKMYSLTVKRNNIRTGKNCASYNRKHLARPAIGKRIFQVIGSA